MKGKAIVHFLDYRLRLNIQEDAYKITIGNLLYINSNKFRNEPLGKEFIFQDKYNKIWDIEVKEDKRTFEEIVDDTLKKRGIKIIRGV